MHSIIATRGNIFETLKTMLDLNSKYFQYNYGDGKMGVVNFNVQPIMLWSIVHPEEALQTLLATLDTKAGYLGNFQHSQLPKPALMMLRTSMGLKAFPDYDKKTSPLPIYKGHLDLMFIGTKEDKRNPDGSEQL